MCIVCIVCQVVRLYNVVMSGEVACCCVCVLRCVSCRVIKPPFSIVPTSLNIIRSSKD